MDSKNIFEALQAKFGEDVVFGYTPASLASTDDYFFVSPDGIVEVARHLRDEPTLAFDFLECLTGVDYPDAFVRTPQEEQTSEKGTIHVVYHLRSYDKKHRAVMKASLSRTDPRIATLCPIWSAANWQERECFDLLGVHFEGHPDLRRIMLPDDWVGHPLRKDYEEAPFYQGIPTTRPNPLAMLAKKAASEAAKPAAKAKAEPQATAKEKPKAAAKTQEKPVSESATAKEAEKQDKSKDDGDTIGS
ncbi:MAG TPA: NADH-quinone oxidoreductase subunit C [Polyangiaceae bacterium]|jgi:NADH-quinone oxidoreductase subunit C|nr:MAG: NAD(P)H-quinone oxidoreductase subunit J [Deltaproteobacteria bacterium ADurb.Bin207]HNS95675.1 NADH-quinone oxidoreductase subunit C [Polyangiaceae bacterium]HNZ25323.1 NADH-quinone oxidoreductase subunit C [Polyangiaceae bacterium]HOD24935.1 NADH-quinone oxidoreductase subunit C [Polyangiaceae bacterium]HOE50390.1 NADH-quinone oxidoreductase subunit C [Polyangiaceae bacterium]